jgi:flavodoxin
MKVVVVYESLWGNTAAIALAVAEGIGPEVTVLSTAEATPGALAGADLIVAGAPLLGFRVPNDGMLQSIRRGREKVAPDVSQPAMRTWLDGLPKGQGRSAAFETRIWWSPGSAAKAISSALEQLGYTPVGKPERFIVKGRYGPLREGELERAKAWGTELAQSLK